jgi:hypothetical protein
MTKEKKIQRTQIKFLSNSSDAPDIGFYLPDIRQAYQYRILKKPD